MKTLLFLILSTVSIAADYTRIVVPSLGEDPNIAVVTASVHSDLPMWIGIVEEGTPTDVIQAEPIFLDLLALQLDPNSPDKTFSWHEMGSEKPYGFKSLNKRLYGIDILYHSQRPGNALCLITQKPDWIWMYVVYKDQTDLWVWHKNDWICFKDVKYE